MTMNFNPGYNPQMMNPQVPYPQMRYNPVETQVQNANGNQQGRVVPVQSRQDALMAQIPMDGSVTYFVYGDELMAKSFSFLSGKIETKFYQPITLDTAEEAKEDRLKNIEEKLDELLKKQELSSQANTTKKKEVTKDD